MGVTQWKARYQEVTCYWAHLDFEFSFTRGTEKTVKQSIIDHQSHVSFLLRNKRSTTSSRWKKHIRYSLLVLYCRKNSKFKDTHLFGDVELTRKKWKVSKFYNLQTDQSFNMLSTISWQLYYYLKKVTVPAPASCKWRGASRRTVVQFR